MMSKEHIFGTYTTCEILPDGVREAVESCMSCGYERSVLYDAESNITVADVWLDYVQNSLQMALPAPDCPPSQAWQDAAAAVQRARDVWDQLDNIKGVAQTMNTLFRECGAKAEQKITDISELITSVGVVVD